MSFNDPFAPKTIPLADEIPEAETLDSLVIADELLAQYKTAKALLREAEFDDTIPLNQKAQTLNAINAILTTITKNRESVRNMAEIGILEVALGDTLKLFPEIKEAFLTAYVGKLLAGLRDL